MASETDRPVAFCADIGGTFIKFAAVGEAGDLGNTQRLPTPARDWESLVATLAALCGSGPPEAPLGLSVAGTVDPDGGGAFSANVPCLIGRRLAAELGAALGRPVRVANDADCMVLAEAAAGAGTGHRVVFGIVLGSGVGGGLVVSGQIVRGAGGVTGEWGHGALLGAITVGGVTIPPQSCGCGNVGCLDTLGGARGLGRLHGLLHGVSADSREICGAWALGEEAATATIDAWLRLMAGPLSTMINVTGAGVVPVAGGLGNDARLIAALDAAVRRGMLRKSATPVVVPSRFGDDAGLRGAALLVNEVDLRADGAGQNVASRHHPVASGASRDAPPYGRRTVTDQSAFGIGETRELDIAAGQETTIRAGSEVSRLKISFDDGAEVELTIGPNEVVRVKRGSAPIRILFEDPGASVHDPLRAAD